jgi:serine protein kinase
MPIFDELKELVSDPSIYEFLKQEPRHGYHEARKFIDTVREWWLDVFDEEVRTSMGLVEETRYDELFARYVWQISAHVKKEKLFDKVTGKYVEPDQDLMREVEDVLLAGNESREDFRRAVIGRIGAWGLENPGQSPSYRKLFPVYIEKLEDDYFRRQKRIIRKNLEALLDHLGDGELKAFGEEQAAASERTAALLESRFGYHRACTAECAAYLLRQRYHNVDR